MRGSNRVELIALFTAYLYLLKSFSGYFRISDCQVCHALICVKLSFFKYSSKNKTRFCGAGLYTNN